MVIEMTKRRFSVKDFHLMDEAGMFCENDRVELVDGEIIEMAGATKRRFSVKDFYLIVDAGILNKYDQVELVDGEIVEMAPIGSYHNGSVNALNRVFARSVPEDITVQVQGPLRVDDTTVFQPDLAILRPKEDEYFETIPAPDDVLLVIEVSDSTEAYDRNVKIPKYAQAGVPEVWLDNLPHGFIDRFVDPDTATGRYRSATRHSRGQRIAPTQLRGIAVEVSDILRRPE